MFVIFTIFADWITYSILNLDQNKHLTHSLHFFIEDITKIFVMLVILIYLIGIMRASLDIERVRDYLSGKNRYAGYLMAAAFGAVTPFCSCSSIPLFLAFTAARIPVGITMAFLITSPIVNEVAVLLLGSILGLKFTVIYVSVGIISGMLGGWFFDLIKAEKHLSPLGAKSLDMAATQQANGCSCECSKESTSATITWSERHEFAKNEVKEIVKRIWKWVIIGISVGAIFHGFVPAEWVESNLAAGDWWTVPLASILGIPLYSNASAMIPVAESMLLKGVPVGTTLTFMMSVVGASIPEFLMLKQVMKPKLLITLFSLLLILFSTSGLIFNYIAPIIGVMTK
ncbi:MAG: permease [Gammaproteobacteria bacterium]|nr:MAG: permease [Gammaproteobacteria bacterium]